MTLSILDEVIPFGRPAVMKDGRLRATASKELIRDVLLRWPIRYEHFPFLLPEVLSMKSSRQPVIMHLLLSEPLPRRVCTCIPDLRDLYSIPAPEGTESCTNAKVRPSVRT